MRSSIDIELLIIDSLKRLTEDGSIFEEGFAHSQRFYEERDILATILVQDMNKYVVNSITITESEQERAFYIANYLDTIEENWRTAIEKVCKEDSEFLGVTFPLVCIVFHAMRLEVKEDPTLIKVWVENSKFPHLDDRVNRAKSYVIDGLNDMGTDLE